MDNTESDANCANDREERADLRFQATFPVPVRETAVGRGLGQRKSWGRIDPLAPALRPFHPALSRCFSGLLYDSNAPPHYSVHKARPVS